MERGGALPQGVLAGGHGVDEELDVFGIGSPPTSGRRPVASAPMTVVSSSDSKTRIGFRKRGTCRRQSPRASGVRHDDRVDLPSYVSTHRSEESKALSSGRRGVRTAR